MPFFKMFSSFYAKIEMTGFWENNFRFFFEFILDTHVLIFISILIRAQTPVGCEQTQFCVRKRHSICMLLNHVIIDFFM